MNKILTIAVPVYNMEKLLPRCLDSLVKAENLNDVEILIINDGSKDDSLKIAKQYEAKYPESIMAIDKPNGGWGTVINLAMQKATGKYFKILDSDDWFKTAEFEKLVNPLQTTDADLVASSYTEIYDNENPKTILFSKSICGKVMEFEKRLIALQYKTDIPMATVCYKTQVLKDIGLQVADKYYADVEYTLVPLSYIRTIIYTRFNVYQYYLGRVDHSTSTRGYINHSDDFLNMVRKLVLYYESTKPQGTLKVFFQKELRKLIRFCYTLNLSTAYRGGSKEALESIKEFDSSLRETSPYLYRQVAKENVRGFIPFIKIWRSTKINVLNLRKWI